MRERFDVVSDEDAPAGADARVRALRTAYHARRLVVSDDRGALARTRLRGGRAIDARDVADAMLRDVLRSQSR